MRESGRRRQLALMGAAHSFSHSLFVIATPLLGLILVSLSSDELTIGAVSGLASFIYGAGALIGGPLGDRIGEVRTIILSLSLSGLATFMMLLAGNFQSIVIYGLALALMAVWASLYHPTANSLISKVFAGRVPQSMGWHGLGGNVGVILTPLLALSIGTAFGWAWAFVAFGVACVAVAGLFAKVFRGIKKGTAEGGSLVNVFRIRELWLLLAFNIAIGLFMRGVDLFFVLYIQNNRLAGLGLTSGEQRFWATSALTGLLAVGIPAQLVGGRAADRVGSKRVLIFTSTGILLSFLALQLFPIYAVGVAIFAALYGFAFYAHQPALNALTGFCCPPRQRGAVFGIFFFTSFGLGSISQVLAGAIGQIYGMDISFYMLTAFAAIALLLSFKLPEKTESTLPGPSCAPVS